MSTTSAWLDEHWSSLRAFTDGALKQIGQLLAAVVCTETDPDDPFIHNVVAKLSDWLCCLDTSVGDERPAAGGELDREWLGKHWRDLRESVDDALTALGSVPVAISDIKADPDHIEELVVRLSGDLTAISNYVGKHSPCAEPLHNWGSEAAE